MFFSERKSLQSLCGKLQRLQFGDHGLQHAIGDLERCDTSEATETQLLRNAAKTTEPHPQNQELPKSHLVSHSAIGQVQSVPSVVFLLWVLRPS